MCCMFVIAYGMKHIGIVVLFLCGMFYFSAGKSCPEKTRPHKTRCDAFYKCQNMPPNTHVWIPSICEQGLVYKHNMKSCVLPDENWECILEETTTHVEKQIQVPNNTKLLAEHTGQDVYPYKNVESASENKDKESINIVMNSSLNSEEEDDDLSNAYESSGNGDELLQINGLQAEAKDATDNIIGTEQKENYDSHSVPETSSRIDPTLAAHLQRLSQLIDGLKQTYQSQDNEQTELRPDQLNAFLAHFNIKNKFNSLTPLKDPDVSKTSNISSRPPLSTKLQPASQHKHGHQDLGSKMSPETKVMLSNDSPNNHDSESYSASHLVGNRPEDSIVYSLTPYCNEQHFFENSNTFEPYHSPKISDDTLKTVLELSKQMVATPNLPKVILNPTYYSQSLMQPHYFANPDSHSPFSYLGKNPNNRNSEHYSNDNNRYKTPAIGHKYQPFGTNIVQANHGHRQSNDYSQPSTTIIHNNVIPVHVSSTNSGEREVFDSYGQSLGRYPPLNANSGNSGQENNPPNHHTSNTNLYDRDTYLSNGSTMRPTIQANHYSGEYSSSYPAEIAVTTMQPLDYQVTSSTLAEYFTPSQHLNEHNVHHLYEPSDRFPTVQYGNSPQPLDPVGLSQNQKNEQMERPHKQQQHRYNDHYNTNTLFSSQAVSNKVKKQNSQKLESMEANVSAELSDFEDQGTYNQQSNAYINEGFSHQYAPSLNLRHGNRKYPTYLITSQSAKPLVPNYVSPTRVGNNKLKPPRHASSSQIAEGMQLVNVGGNFIRYDVFQNSILPILGNPHTDELSNVEVITCATGVRQPNSTDCTRYYVCSKKDGKILSYSCPPYTAFNSQTRICDAHTYSLCSPSAAVSSYAITENNRIQLEAYQALQDVKRRHDDAIRAQSIANRLHQYDAEVNAPVSSETSSSQERDMLGTYVQQAASMASSTSKPSKKRKYYCKEGEKIADQTSVYGYFVCYKNAQGTMKGHKMTCSKGLLFCPKTTVCTVPAKCT